jgi:predicted CoA-binding protein
MNLIKEMLKNSKTIAVIGFKDRGSGPAYSVPYYMQEHGYKIYPVNPKLAGQKILGEQVSAKVNDISDKIDLVDVFRRPEFLTEHAKEILKMKPLPQYVWFQLGIYNDEAAKMLEEKGIKVIQNKCIKVEHANFF